MNTTAKCCFFFGCLLLASLIPCMASPKPTGAIIVRLDDIQGLWGGQTVMVDTDGNLFARKVDEQHKEKRYHLKLSPEDLTALLDFIAASGIQDYREGNRPGKPDEAHPEITISLPKQQKKIAAKWASVKDLKFDKLYERLMQLRDQAAKSPPYESRTHDYRAAYP